jgi:hypothetical protein
MRQTDNLASMKRIFIACLTLTAIMFVSSCNDYETYAEQTEKEHNAIREFIADRNINVITEATFKEQGNTTDVSKNEFVLFDNTGVYMQIVRKGCGSPIAAGETTGVLCRFNEYNILTDSLILSNNVMSLSYLVDKMNVTRTSDSFTASFVSGVMYQQYSNASVPAGWLVPLLYINVGRWEKEGDEIAKVNIIVPHSQGHQSSMTGVYPCYYELTYEKGR